MSNLYSRLFKYRSRERRAPLEDYLSEALVDLMQRMPPSTMLAFVAETFLPEQTREAWINHATGKTITWITQRTTDGALRGVIDILAEVDGRPALIIENKIASGVRGHAWWTDRSENQTLPPITDATQLTTYGDWLAARVLADNWPGALAFLTHLTPPPSDFLKPDAPYGIRNRHVASWAGVAGWLRREGRLSTPANDRSPEPWLALAEEFIAFLEEHAMSAETITPDDIAATQLYLAPWERMQATFDQIWIRLQTFRQEVCGRNQTVKLTYDSDRGIVSTWNFPRGEFAPVERNGWIEIGFRFPHQTEAWAGSGLPEHPHAFLCLSCDEESLPLERIKTPVAGWHECEGALVAAKPLHEFSPTPEILVSELCDWFDEQTQSAVPLLKAMGAKA